MRNRSLAGHRAKRNGDVFENVFKFRCEQMGMGVTKIPNGGRITYVGGKKTLVAQKSPFDWIVSFAGKTILVDTKTVDAENFAHSAIDSHQVANLHVHWRQQVLSGYVLWLRKKDLVGFVPTPRLLMGLNKSGSIKPTDTCFLSLGTGSNFNPCFDPRPLFQLEAR